MSSSSVASGRTSSRCADNDDTNAYRPASANAEHEARSSRHVPAHVRDRVERTTGERPESVRAIGVHVLGLRPGILFAGSAMEDGDVVPSLQREPGESAAREACPADQQQLHALLLGQAATTVKALGRDATRKRPTVTRWVARPFSRVYEPASRRPTPAREVGT